ncbi:unnamed protein product [Urochloa humidicola]
MTKLVIILVLLVASISCTALQAQEATTTQLQDHKDDDAVLEVDTVGASNNQCQYTMKIKTAVSWGAGTGSRLLIRFYNYKDSAIAERVHQDLYTGTLNTFKFKDECRDRLCFLRINSDGSGYDPDWKCEWISITIEGEGRKTFTHKFNVDKWIGPKTKTYLDIDDCASVPAQENQGLSSFTI